VEANKPSLLSPSRFGGSASVQVTPSPVEVFAPVPVPGLEEIYAVSTHGRVIRIAPGHSTYPGREIKSRPCSSGRYRNVCLSADGQLYHPLVHRLVAGAFLPATPGAVVDHLDSDGHHNTIWNLRLVTQGENVRATIARGRLARGERLHRSPITADDVREIRRLRGVVSGVELAERYGVSPSAISLIQRRLSWGHVD
jgi:hypothetical protein